MSGDWVIYKETQAREEGKDMWPNVDRQDLMRGAMCAGGRSLMMGVTNS